MVLDKVIATFGALFVILGFTMAGALFCGMVGQWYAVENQAQFLAQSQAKYGGYTTEADAGMEEFCNDFKLSSNDLDVDVSAAGGPVPWGQTVTAELTVPFKFEVGSFVAPFTVPLTGCGRAVSAYQSGFYDVTYTSP